MGACWRRSSRSRLHSTMYALGARGHSWTPRWKVLKPWPSFAWCLRNDLGYFHRRGCSATFSPGHSAICSRKKIVHSCVGLLDTVSDPSPGLRTILRVESNLPYRVNFATHSGGASIPKVITASSPTTPCVIRATSGHRKSSGLAVLPASSSARAILHAGCSSAMPSDDSRSWSSLVYLASQRLSIPRSPRCCTR